MSQFIIWAKKKNVGLFNYELEFRGRHNLQSVSQNIVQDKAKNFIYLKYKEFTKFKKKADDIRELKI